jgi:uncharacterized protein YdaU (DUF1376 family)
MAKDPAFLFYSDNFQSGTQFLTDEQCGKYIRLLCAQHLHGHLSERQVLIICKSYDEDIMSKFKKDEDGKYYNERLEFEINRRKKYSESRSTNRKSNIKDKKHMNNISKTYDNHMETETEIENIIINNKEKVSKFKKPSLEEVKQYCAERNKGVDAERFFNYYESNGWQIGKNKMKNWKAAVHTWEKNNVQPVKSKLVL